MQDDEILDRFGKEVIEHVRDKSIWNFEATIDAPNQRKFKMQTFPGLGEMTDDEIKTVKDFSRYVVDICLHNMLFFLQDFERNYPITVNYEPEKPVLTKLSDGLHGEIFGEDGWIRKYSEYDTDVD